MEYKKWECVVCGWTYDEEQGHPDDGIAPGTKWEDIPDDWVCPECGVGKEDFDMIEAQQLCQPMGNALLFLYLELVQHIQLL